MSFATFEDYAAAMDLVGRYRSMTKTFATQRAAAGYSLWPRGGIPAAGLYPAAGLNSAVALDRNSVGAIETINAPAGQRNYLARQRADAASASTIPRAFLLVDRLAHATVSITTLSGAFSPTIDGTARLAAGEGAFIFVEVATALGTGTNTFSLTYTNQAGTTGRVTPNIVSVASAAQQTTVYANFLWMPLAAGDVGARAITDWTLVSGVQTGTISISLLKPIAWVGQPSLLLPVELEYGVTAVYPPVIPEDACLAVILCIGSSSNNQYQGGLTVVSG